MEDDAFIVTTEIVERAAAALKISYRKYLDKLQLGSEFEDLDIYRDSVIQRFEYTFDTARQLIKRILDQYFDRLEYHYRKDLFREAMRLQLIENAETWITYTNDRNRTSHEYFVKHTKNLLETMDSFIFDVTDCLNRIRAVEKNANLSKN